MPSVDEEIFEEQARREELEAEKRRQAQIQRNLRRRQTQAGLQKAAKKAAKKVVVATARSALSAVASFLAPFLGTILIVLGVIFIVVAVLVALCNQGGIVAKLGSSVGYSTGFLPVDFCEAISGVGNAVTGVYQGAKNLMCDSPATIAQQNNEPYPAQADPDLQKMINCVSARVNGNTGVIYTYDQTYMICNYTRGQKICSDECSHAVGSCHYGGSSGSTGALAADFAVVGQAGASVLQAAQYCSLPSQLNIPLKRSTCEDENAKAISCTAAGADHVHMSIGKCDADSGLVNSQ